MKKQSGYQFHNATRAAVKEIEANPDMPAKEKNR